VVVLKPVGDGLVPGVVTPQHAKVSEQLPQPPSTTFVSPTVAVTEPSQAAIIQKLLQSGAFVVGRLPNDNQPYLLPSSGVGLQPFQVVFGSAGAKLPAGADPAAVPMHRAAGNVKPGASSADGMSEEAAVAASHLLAEESHEVAEKMLEDNADMTLSTKGHSTVQSLSQPAVTSVSQVSYIPFHFVQTDHTAVAVNVFFHAFSVRIISLMFTINSIVVVGNQLNYVRLTSLFDNHLIRSSID